MSKLNPTAKNLSEQEYETASSTGHPSLQTLEPPILDQWPDWWTSSLRGSPANLTPKPGNALAKSILATSGPTPYGSYGKWSQATSSWRMSEDWLTGLNRTLRKSLGNFPRQGMTQGGTCCPLPKLELHISESDGGVWHIPTPTVSDVYTGGLASSQQKETTSHSVTLPQFAQRYTRETTPKPWAGGLWPTPVANDDNKSPEAHMRMKSNMKGGPRKKPTSLNVVVKGVEQGAWPSPNVSDATGSRLSKSKARPNEGGLLKAVRWMTPNVMDSLTAKSQDALDHEHDTARPGRSNPNNLRDQVQVEEGQRTWPGMWRTPDAYPRGGPQDAEKRKKGGHSVNLQDQVWSTPTATERSGINPHTGSGAGLSKEVGGQLNPDWVEWLMGIPIGWTSLEPLPEGAWGEGGWWDEEPDIPRVGTGIPNRVARLKAIGNGIVPAVVALFLNAEEEEVDNHQLRFKLEEEY